jgi:hypothetical protein
LNTLGAHVNGASLLPIIRFPKSGLQDPFHENRAALLQILTASLGLFVPHRYRQETNLFL